MKDKRLLIIILFLTIVLIIVNFIFIIIIKNKVSSDFNISYIDTYYDNDNSTFTISFDYDYNTSKGDIIIRTSDLLFDCYDKNNVFIDTLARSESERDETLSVLKWVDVPSNYKDITYCRFAGFIEK